MYRKKCPLQKKTVEYNVERYFFKDISWAVIKYVTGCFLFINNR